MRSLRLAWEAGHRPGSVVGLAPSATAAHVLGQDLAIGTETIECRLTDSVDAAQAQS
jgi:hypothetical protein